MCMLSVVRHLHDVCAVHIRWNSVLDLSSLVYRLQLRLGLDRKWILFLLFFSFFFFFFFVLKSDEHLCLALLT